MARAVTLLRVSDPHWTLRCRSRWPGREDVPIPMDEQTSIYDSLRAGRRPIAGACTGEAVCGRCTVRILEGPDRVTAMGDEERGVLARLGADPGMRLACRTWPTGDGVVVGTDYW